MRTQVRALLSRSKERAMVILGRSPAVAAYEWGGPGYPSAALELSVRHVADLALIQGVVPVGQPSDLVIELAEASGERVATVPITELMPHPSRGQGEECCFVLTFDEQDLGVATKCRLVVDGSVMSWAALPKLATPLGMPGIESIDRCPACDGTAMIDAGRRQGLTMQRCGGCGLMMTSPRPVEDHTLVRYSDAYFTGEYLASQDEGPGMVRHWDNLLGAVEPYRSVSPTLYEIGVGGGNFLAHARRKGWSVSGSDVNAAAVEHAVERGLAVSLNNVDHAETLGGPYGVIVSEMSLEHTRRPEHVVDVASRSLLPGGALLIFTVSHEGASFRYEGMASHLVGPAEHLFLFSADSLVALSERAGLRVERVWRGPHGDEIGVIASK